MKNTNYEKCGRRRLYHLSKTYKHMKNTHTKKKPNYAEVNKMSFTNFYLISKLIQTTPKTKVRLPKFLTCDQKMSDMKERSQEEGLGRLLQR